MKRGKKQKGSGKEEKSYAYAMLSGISDCSPEKFEVLMSALEEIDLTKIVELEDDTNLSGELACSGGACEIV